MISYEDIAEAIVKKNSVKYNKFVRGIEKAVDAELNLLGRSSISKYRTTATITEIVLETILQAYKDDQIS